MLIKHYIKFDRIYNSKMKHESGNSFSLSSGTVKFFVVSCVIVRGSNNALLVE
jgi:hypothetical protein